MILDRQTPGQLSATNRCASTQNDSVKGHGRTAFAEWGAGACKGFSTRAGSMASAAAKRAKSGAYIDPDLRFAGNEAGPLKGLTFAVKDLYDVCTALFGHPQSLFPERQKLTCYCSAARLVCLILPDQPLGYCKGLLDRPPCP